MELKTVVEYALAFLTIFATVFFMLVYLENREEVKKPNGKSKKFPSITIIIPAFNEGNNIAKTIESALAASYPKKQVIVVDDGSLDNTLEVARRFEKRGVLVLTQANKGKSAALNNALRHAKGELVATLDADTVIEKDALEKMVGFFDDEKVAAVTSAIKVLQPKTILEKFQRLEYLQIIFIRKVLSLINGVNVTPGPLSLFRRKVFDEVGNFDEKSILEDQEIALRIQAADYKIASSLDAVVYTSVPKSLGSLIRQRVRWNRGGLRNLLKHRYLMGPKYGDLGLLIIPMAILSILMVFTALVLGVSALLNNSLGQTFSAGLQGVVLGTNPLYAVSAIIFILTIAWVFLGVRQLKNERITFLDVVFYLVVYAQLVAVCWLATAFEEIAGKRQRW